MQALHRNLNESHKFESGLDMGAGTGILSVLMYKRGLQRVQACEIDEMARDKCRENLDLNSCQEVVVCGPGELSSSKVDLVVANIIDGVLLKIKDDLVSRTGKLLILSGILLENEDEVLQAFSSKGLTLTKRSSRDEWACLEFKANA
jgi:ribosomal protein L11 methyltransferase